MIEEFKKLGLPADKYVITGSTVLELHGIRKARFKDLDFIGMPDVFKELRRRKWKTKRFFIGWPFRKAVEHEGMECYSNMKLRSYRPETADIIRRADVINGISYMSLEDMAAFKAVLGREKDLNDIRLIREHIHAGNCPICSARA